MMEKGSPSRPFSVGFLKQEVVVGGGVSQIRKKGVMGRFN